MVRFKPAWPACDSVSYRSFNSTMVRFKLVGSTEDHSLMTGFNSTMVRFKPRCLERAQPMIDAFQFHDGSIQACRRDEQIAGRDMFQFHDGSIQARAQDKNKEKLDSFQFHDGSIQALIACRFGAVQFLVSIPRWFDSSLSSRASNQRF